jgi:uncharacterized protein YoxC
MTIQTLSAIVSQLGVLVFCIAFLIEYKSTARSLKNIRETFKSFSKLWDFQYDDIERRLKKLEGKQCSNTPK